VTEKPLTIDDRARLKELEDENHRLRMEREILKSRSVVCESEPVRFAFIQGMEEDERRKPRKERIPTSLICEVLEVSRAGYYA